MGCLRGGALGSAVKTGVGVPCFRQLINTIIGNCMNAPKLVCEKPCVARTMFE